ncbi:MAG: hypothetical protein GX044_07565 [Firmicutes bacterium]|jgi:hypothetical protein|nr:hypothetical protein [Bacillota bacterium]
MKKEYGHLIKPLLVRQPPDGLYPEPRVWMEGKDLEGFNAHFSYGFFKEPASFHPVEGAVVHPYDECLVFVGTDHTNIRYLGAEIAIELGEEREEHIFTDPTVVIIPKGLPHGPVTIKQLEKPIVHYSIGLSPEYKGEMIDQKSLPNKTSGSKYSHLLKKFLSDPAPGTDMYEFTRDGVVLASELGVGPGNGDEVVWLFGKDLEGLDVNFSWGFYSKCGKWHRGGEIHTHPEEEILVYVGLDPDNLNYLGAELELGMGKHAERHVFNTPTVAICPQGFPHLPLITRWVDKPYGFFVCCLSGDHDSPWVEFEEEE